MSDDVVRLAFDGAVAVVTLDAPPLNIYDLRVRDGLIEAVTAVRDTPGAGALVLATAGKHFSAGADLSEFGSADSILEGRRIRWDRDPWGVLWDLPVPTIAALRGVALGSGLEMALLCDVRLAAPDVRVGLPEVKLGMLPAAGGTQTLTWALGPSASLPLVALGSECDAAEAERRGLVSRVVDDVEGEALALAHRLAGLDPQLVVAARRALHAAVDLPLVEGLALERRLAALVAGRVPGGPAGGGLAGGGLAGGGDGG